MDTIISKKIRFCSILLITVMSLLAVCSTQNVFAVTPTPAIEAKAAVIIDAETGMVIYDKNMNELNFPASTTKVMTALLALENLELDHVITIDSEVPFTEGSRIYLLEGEKLTVEQLLYGLMLESANDAATALGKEISGSVPEFAELMNERARELGAKNTNFVNANGLHEDDHVTTAYDLAMIAKAAMENETFREIVQTYKYIIPATELQDTRYLYNSNRLIYDEVTLVPVEGVMTPAYYEWATGIKTGYTSKAQECLSASAEKDGTEFISVVLGSHSEGRFGDSIALLDWAFENYKTEIAVNAGEIKGEIQVEGGDGDSVTLVTAKDAPVTIALDLGIESVTEVVKIPETIEAPVEKGQEVGVVEFYQNNVLVNVTPLETAESMEVGGILSTFGVSNATAEIVWDVLIGIGIFFVLIILLLLYIRRQNMKKRKERREKRALRLAMEREMERHHENREKYGGY